MAEQRVVQYIDDQVSDECCMVAVFNACLNQGIFRDYPSVQGEVHRGLIHDHWAPCVALNSRSANEYGLTIAPVRCLFSDMKTAIDQGSCVIAHIRHKVYGRHAVCIVDYRDGNNRTVLCCNVQDYVEDKFIVDKDTRGGTWVMFNGLKLEHKWQWMQPRWAQWQRVRRRTAGGYIEINSLNSNHK